METRGKYDIEISNRFMDCRIFWARTVSSENENLFTQYTKHTFFELQYALNGHFGILVGNDRYIRLNESDFVIIPPDTYHQIVEADEIGARFIMAFSLTLKDDRHSVLLRSLSQPQAVCETRHMRSLLDIIVSKSQKGNDIHTRLTESLLESFLLELFITMYSADDIRIPKSVDVPHITEMQAFIKSHSGIGVQAHDIAEKFNMSERHINRIFKKHTGESPKEYINHEKLRKIEEYIISTKLSLSEISDLCGFCDEYAMNKFFKRYNLTNLSDFRKLSSKNNPRS